MKDNTSVKLRWVRDVELAAYLLCRKYSLMKARPSATPRLAEFGFVDENEIEFWIERWFNDSEKLYIDPRDFARKRTALIRWARQEVG